MSPLGNSHHGSAPKPNAAPALRITLARRLVETPGAPFIESHEVFTDGASALDELGLLTATQGPTVVRVQVENSTASQRVALEGDWLVDPDGSDGVAHLPVPRWGYDSEAKAWASARPWLEAWETCPNAAWMLGAASEVGVEQKLLVLAACACARMALPFVRAGEARPLRAIETAEKWLRGEVSLDEVQRAAAAAGNAAAVTARAAYAAARAASSAASAAAYVASADQYASTAAVLAAIAVADDAATASDNAAAVTARAAYAAARAASADQYAALGAVDDDAVDAAAVAHTAARAAAQARCADLVRSVIPMLTVLRAVATRA